MVNRPPPKFHPAASKEGVATTIKRRDCRFMVFSTFRHILVFSVFVLRPVSLSISGAT